MNKTELVQILTILGSNFQSIGRQMEDQGKRKMICQLWYECLGDIDYKLALAAVKKSIITSAYPPTIHDIRESALSLITKEEDSKTPIEYWNEAFKMIKNGSYMTTEEFESHSDIVKKFFGNVAQVKELAMTDYNTVSTVTKGQFLKQIEIIQARQKENNLIPENIKQLVQGMTNNKMLEGE